jgi:hypothetical protein
MITLCNCLQVGKSPTAVLITFASVAHILGGVVGWSLPTATSMELPNIIQVVQTCSIVFRFLPYARKQESFTHMAFLYRMREELEQKQMYLMCCCGDAHDVSFLN